MQDKKLVGEAKLRKYVSKTSKSRRLYQKGKEVLPSGVSYFIRYFEPYPFYAAKAEGSRIVDVDGNTYIDYWLGHTALILGHSPAHVMEEVKKQIQVGTHFGTSHELEICLAEQVIKMVPNVDMIRFTNSGTEANMYAVRLGRAYTGKNKVLKFEGGWHGGYDALHVAVKPPFTLNESAGLTEGAVKDTVVATYNDIESVRERMKDKDIAAVVVEPVMGAGGCIPSEKNFLEGLRELCDEKNILLIFDEVITGFRLAPGGGQQFYNLKADITVFGKVLGGGFPIGAFCGSKEIMERLDALLYERPHLSFHGGTFTGNPVTMIAGLETLKTLEDGKLIDRMNKRGDKIRRHLKDIFDRVKVGAQVVGAGSLFHTHFTHKEVKDAKAAFESNREKLVEYHMYLVENGVFFLPSHLGALSTKHTDGDIEKYLALTERYAR